MGVDKMAQAPVWRRMLGSLASSFKAPGRPIKYFLPPVMLAAALADCREAKMPPRNPVEREGMQAQSAASSISPFFINKVSSRVGGWRSGGDVAKGFRTFSGELHTMLMRGSPRQLTELYSMVALSLVELERAERGRFFNALRQGVASSKEGSSRAAALFLALPAMANPAPSLETVLGGTPGRDEMQGLEIESLLDIARRTRPDERSPEDPLGTRLSRHVGTAWLDSPPATPEARETFFGQFQRIYRGR